MADKEIPVNAAFDVTLGGERRGVVYERAEVEHMLSAWLEEHGSDPHALDSCEIIQLPEPAAAARGAVGRELPWTAFVRDDQLPRQGSGPRPTPSSRPDGLDATA